MIRAFRTDAIGVTSIVFADSASKARYDTYLCAKDAGYSLRFSDITVLRAPEYDNRRTFDGSIPTGRMCHNPETLKKIE